MAYGKSRRNNERFAEGCFFLYKLLVYEMERLGVFFLLPFRPPPTIFLQFSMQRGGDVTLSLVQPFPTFRVILKIFLNLVVFFFSWLSRSCQSGKFFRPCFSVWYGKMRIFLVRFSFAPSLWGCHDITKR